MSRRTLDELRELWTRFSEVPINDDDEIEREFIGFEAGTNRFEIWSWFDKQCPNGVYRDLVCTEDRGGRRK